MVRPRIIFLFERFVFHFGLSNKTNQIGAAEINMATRELGTVFSAQITAPFPMNRSKMPVTMDILIEARFQRFSPLITHQATINIPADRNRMAPIKKGGKSAIAF